MTSTSSRAMRGIAATAASLCIAAASTPSTAAPVLGDAGYYGAVPAISGLTPSLWNANPIIAIGAAILGTALYLHVPDHHRLHWAQYCSHYDACGRPVYFVRDDWYRNTWAPAYRKQNPGAGAGGGKRGVDAGVRPNARQQPASQNQQNKSWAKQPQQGQQGQSRQGQVKQAQQKQPQQAQQKQAQQKQAQQKQPQQARQQSSKQQPQQKQAGGQQGAGQGRGR